MVEKINKSTTVKQGKPFEHSPHSCKLQEARPSALSTSTIHNGEGRHDRRLGYQIPRTRGVDLASFFQEDYFIYRALIKDYVVTIAFPGCLTALQKLCRQYPKAPLDVQFVSRALNSAYDMTDDIKVDCGCPDWYYRFSYVATVHGYKFGEPQTIPANETNPNDNLGATCKHIDLLLSKRTWLQYSAKQVSDFIRANLDKIRPYLFGDEEPEEEQATEASPEEQEDSNTLQVVSMEEPETAEEPAEEEEILTDDTEESSL